MKRIGRVEKIVRNKLLLVKLDGSEPPRIGETVYASDASPLGKVIDIIGRVEEPYALVKPFREDIAIGNLVNTIIYTKMRHRGKRFLRKRRKKI
jgi:rRNA processing protein Gar1